MWINYGTSEYFCTANKEWYEFIKIFIEKKIWRDLTY